MTNYLELSTALTPAQTPAELSEENTRGGTPKRRRTMSAFFVGKETIDAVATLILMADGPRSLADLNKVAKSCWLMNALAIEQRYTSQSANDFLDVINAYEFKHTEGVGFAAMLKAANCFLYQCNEGNVSEMKLFQKLTAITERYVETTKTDEYDAAPWGLCG